MNIKTLLATIICLLIATGLGWSQSPLTEHTIQLDDQKTSPPASIGDISWLHGFWIGDGFGGQVDETWSAASAGTMVGTFRLIKNSQIEFSEFIEISEKDGSLLLKVKHFDRELNGWEEKEKSIKFPLVRLEGQSAMFDGLTYLIDDQENLRAYVAMKQKDGTFKEGKIVFHRVTSSDLAKGEFKKAVDIELPDNPDAVILTYNVEGGYRVPTPVGFKPTPVFRLLANGKVLVGRNSPNAPELEFQMTKADLDDLLRDIVANHRFFDITTDGLKQQIEATGRPIRVADAPTHRISIDLVNAQHEVESFGLVIIRNMYKDIEDLQKLAAIREKLMFLRSRAALGTQVEVESLVNKMRQEFQKKFPGDDPFTLDDLKYAGVNKDGSVQAQFARIEYENEQPKFTYNCFVQINGDETTLNLSRALIR